MHFFSFLLLRFLLYVLFPFYPLCLFCVFHLLHTTCFYMHKSHSMEKNHPFSILCIFIMPSPLPDHPCKSSSSLVVILSLFINNGLSWDSLPSLAVWHFILFFIVELIFSVVVIGFDTFPSINCIYDQSSFHWQLPQDSLAPLAITLKPLWFLWQKQSVVSGSYPENLCALIPLAPFPFLRKTTQWALAFLAKPLPFTWPRAVIRRLSKRRFTISTISNVKPSDVIAPPLILRWCDLQLWPRVKQEKHFKILHIAKSCCKFPCIYQLVISEMGLSNASSCLHLLTM